MSEPWMIPQKRERCVWDLPGLGLAVDAGLKSSSGPLPACVTPHVWCGCSGVCRKGPEALILHVGLWLSFATLAEEKLPEALLTPQHGVCPAAPQSTMDARMRGQESEERLLGGAVTVGKPCTSLAGRVWCWGVGVLHPDLHVAPHLRCPLGWSHRPAGHLSAVSQFWRRGPLLRHDRLLSPSPLLGLETHGVPCPNCCSLSG